MARMNERGSLQLLLPAGSFVSAVIFARDEQNTFSFRTTLFLPRNPVSYFYSGGKKECANRNSKDVTSTDWTSDFYKYF